MTITLEPLAETMNCSNADHSWESDLAGLLEDLTQVQEELLAVLARKRQCMCDGDLPGMKELQSAELALCERLQACHDRRGELLQQAAQEGLPSVNLGSLASRIGRRSERDLGREVKNASARMTLLQHNCLVNWVLSTKSAPARFTDVGDYCDRWSITANVWQPCRSYRQWRIGGSGGLDRLR